MARGLREAARDLGEAVRRGALPLGGAPRPGRGVRQGRRRGAPVAATPTSYSSETGATPAGDDDDDGQRARVRRPRCPRAPSPPTRRSPHCARSSPATDARRHPFADAGRAPHEARSPHEGGRASARPGRCAAGPPRPAARVAACRSPSATSRRCCPWWVARGGCRPRPWSSARWHRTTRGSSPGAARAGFSHSLLGIVTVDLAVGLLAFVVWRRWAQAPGARPRAAAGGGAAAAATGAGRARPALGGARAWCWGRSPTSSGTRSPMPAAGASTSCRGCTTEHLGARLHVGPGTSAACSGCVVAGRLERCVGSARTDPDGDGPARARPRPRSAWCARGRGRRWSAALFGLLRFVGSARGGALRRRSRSVAPALAVGVVLACALWWVRVRTPRRGRGSPRVACPAWHAASRRTRRSTSRGCSSSPGPGTTWC